MQILAALLVSPLFIPRVLIFMIGFTESMMEEDLTPYSASENTINPECFPYVF